MFSGVDSSGIIDWALDVIDRIEVKAEWDPDANVWVVTSFDLPNQEFELQAIERDYIGFEDGND
ncbi:MAG: hypothetical protein EXR70_09850 [Deltaproteobacteria bacterium]|nr:hypothetical protein [Deltaproteobacteria bacterium]